MVGKKQQVTKGGRPKPAPAVLAGAPIQPPRFRERQSLGSRGIAVLVKSDSALAREHGQLWRVSEHGTHLWLRFQQTWINNGETLFLCVAYLPPRGSVFWERGVSETDVFA
jgi:hypothetical protein